MQVINRKEIDKLLEGIGPSTIYIGTDSIRKGRKIFYCTVVVVHIENSKGAKIFLKTETEKAKTPRRGNINDILHRLTKEVDMTVKTIEYLKDVLDKYSDKHKLEVHIDINPSEDYKSHMVYGYAMSYVKGYLGIEPKFKPEAFAASVAADGIVRGKNKRETTFRTK